MKIQLRSTFHRRASRSRALAMLLRQTIRGFSTGNVQVPLKLYSLEGRYATALFTAATKMSNLPVVESELSKIRNAIKKSPQLQALIENPVIDRSIKQKYVSELLTKEKYSPAVINFFKVLAENGRLSMTSKIMNAFDDIIKAQRGQVDFKLVSSKELSKEVIEKLKETVSKRLIQPGQQLNVSTKIDPEIIGGIILQIGDKTIDMSVASRLRKIKQALA